MSVFFVWQAKRMRDINCIQDSDSVLLQTLIAPRLSREHWLVAFCEVHM